MTPDDREAGLTAFALNDPCLTPVERAEIEQRLAADPAARREVEEVREVARLLSAGLAAELTTADPPAVTVPSEVAAKPKARRPVGPLIAASLTFGLLGLLGVASLFNNSAGKTATTKVSSSLALAAKPVAKPAEASRELAATAQVPPHYAEVDRDKETSELRAADMKLRRAEVARALLPEPAGKPTPSPSPALPTAPPGLGEVDRLPSVQPTLPLIVRGSTPYQAGRGYKLRGDAAGAKPQPHYGEAIAPNRATNESRLADPVGGDRFPATVENAFTTVEGQNALSTFGVDVDTASYSIVRSYLARGQLPPADAVRLEEVVNYFPYADKPPAGDDPFAVTVEVAGCPWQTQHRLARIGLKAKPIAADKRPPSNLVFLVDVSGSMNEPNKLPLVKASLKLLVGQLGENDRVAMVVYAGTTGLVLDSTSAVNKGRILEALDRLEAGGSTNGSGGLQQAYDVAVANFVKGGTNRVVLCTDGDWNVGVTGTDALVKMIEEKRATGVFLSVFGFGMGNLRDEMMVKLAGKGNGNYGYIDTLREANKALVEQLGGTLVTVAKDVKIQVEFNPAAVKAYRLLGYEKRALAAKDFADDTKDAGEMGAGHTVTALYELVPAGDPAPAAGDGLRYQPNPESKPAAAPVPPAKEAFLVKMRHKKPDGDVSVLRELPVPNAATNYREASDDFRFSAAAAAFALILRDSSHKGDATLSSALELAEGAMRTDPGGYRAEFADLVRRAKAISAKR